MKTFLKNSSAISASLADLGNIRGITSREVDAIQKQLGVNSIRELIPFISNGQLETVTALTPLQIKNIKRGLKLYKTAESRFPLWDAYLMGEELSKAIRQCPEVEKVMLAGSLRRGKDTIGDIDILVQLNDADRRKLLYKIARMPQVENIIAAGPHHFCVVLHNQMQADIRLAPSRYFGASLLYYTGSVKYNAEMEELAASKGFRITPEGLMDSHTGEYVAGEQEVDIYRKLQLDFVAPELREDHDILTAAAVHEIPLLVTFDQLKGDMQIHTNWSDGAESIAGIAKYMSHAFPHYHYIVITDHVSSTRTNHVLHPEDVFRQIAEINRVNALMGYDYIKKGAEIDILENGEAALSDDILQQFDWVIASIHSDFSRDNTSRLIQICKNPYVNCIGHPSGRLIGIRKPYPVNWDEVFTAAAASGTAMEINSRPNRLDLHDEQIRLAVSKGVKMVINSDARTLTHLDFVKLGISTARRGSCRKTDILNTGSWNEIEKFKAEKQQLLKK
ncbi:DNA polymerase III [Chitinophaga qingshengii]|uniref:DNA polymerase III n=1 Tax=Chitinophaga qingshengii TaxID=1569794 RepID=A0ABR7TFA1_9BACT|nr:DNA polymerase III [Chitinophaga qingshengii]MBC9928987.1 DNA polymerase III [Chitinophaga qingshengii]